MCDPVDFFGEAPFDPYLLGLIIGDGCICDGMIEVTSSDIDEMISLVSQKLIVGHKIQKNFERNRCGSFYVMSDDPYQNIYKMWLKVLGLWGAKAYDKFIPDVFKMCRSADRIALLQGLMDTDGYVSKEGTLQFTTTSSRLSDDFKWLVQSLGGTSRVSERHPTYIHKGKRRTGRLAYIHTICLPSGISPVRINRKASRLKRNRKYFPVRKITEIVSVGEKECVCIKVSASDQLYLTDNFIVTHNTPIAIGSFMDERVRPACVVVQTHLPKQWQEQIDKFTDLKVHLVKGTRPYQLPPADVYVMKYSCVAGWVDTFATGIFKSVVFDEIQELRKPESQKYQAAAELARNVEYVLGLSATPIYNYGDEAFSIFNVMKEGCIGDRQDFLREWANGYGREIKDPKALGAYLRENHLFLRRTKQDVKSALQPVNKIVHQVGFDEDAVAKVESIARQLALKVTTGSFIERGRAARELDLLMRQSTGVSKAKYVAEYVKILLENKEPVLLAGWHRDVYEIWEKEFKDYNPVMYTGSESPNQKEKAKQAFINGESDLMIISLRSGIGLDGLQHRCSIVVFGELDWSPAVHEQVIGRLYRDGQKNQVMAIFLVSDSGSDPLMVDLLGLKASQANDIINPFSPVSEQFSDDSRIKMLAERLLSQKGSQ